MKSRIATDAPKTAAYHTSKRKPVLRKKLLADIQRVPRAAHRVYQVIIEFPVNLGAQPADVGLDHAGVRIEMKSPDVLQEHGPRHHLPGIAHQVLEQPEFLRLQIDFL